MSKNSSLKKIIISVIIFGIIILVGILFSGDIRKQIKKNLPNSLTPLAKELILFYNHEFRKSLTLNKIEQVNSIKINTKNYSITKYQNNLFKENGPRAYIALKDDNLFLVTGTGIIFSTNIKDLNNNKLKLSKVSNNLDKIFGFKYMAQYSSFVTGILFIKNEIYLSYSNQIKKDCFNTSILKGKINSKKIIFEEFFTPSECVSTINEYGEFNLGNAGGALSKFVNNKILFSIGDYGYRTYAQNVNNIFGKVLSLDLNSKKIKILSLGHRNVQGLYYDNKNNIILSSEHGPEGGDEINVNFNKLENIKNFGWPISSYGEHYGGKNEPNNKKKYITAPLNKSHEDFGFIEPVKYFTPSVAPSRILLIDKNFLFNDNHQVLLSTLGYRSKIKQGHMSLHYFVFNDKFKVMDHQIIPVKERTRDMIYSKKHNKIFFFFESSGSIGILDNK